MCFTLQRILCLQHIFGGQEVPFDVVEYIPSTANRQDDQDKDTPVAITKPIMNPFRDGNIFQGSRVTRGHVRPGDGDGRENGKGNHGVLQFHWFQCAGVVSLLGDD